MRKEENKPEAPERKITMGSLFDGIGGFPLAAVRNGIEPVWASEIEAFPIAVTKLRFPQMQHVGDITKLDGAKLTPVDIVSLLESQGETVKRSGKEYEWRDGSAKVTLRGNLWFHQYDREGGDAIDFMKRFYNMEYTDAVLYLTGGGMEKLCKRPEQEQDYPELVLPERNDNMRRVFAYLTKQREIDRSVVEAFAHHGMIYESAKYHNVVFVGYDREGRPRHANLRGTGHESTFKGNAPNSNPAYSFHWHGSSSSLYLFEAPIDLMSYLSLHPEDWRENSYAAACSVSDRVLFQMLEDNRNISQVCICFDSDEPGQSAARRIDNKLFTMGIKSQILVPNQKDWNEDLVCLKSESEVMEPCQSIGL